MFRLGINASRLVFRRPLIRGTRTFRFGRSLLQEQGTVKSSPLNNAPLKNAPKVDIPPSSSPKTGPSSGPSSGSSSKKSTLKELTKKYGWAAVGVYLTISAIDLPVAFFIVHSMGKEKVQEIEKAVKGFFGFSTKPDDLSTVQEGDTIENGKVVNKEVDEDSSSWSLFLTEFTLAYAIHKSLFLFIRIPATAALTPWAVKKLQSWGFNIGKNIVAKSGAARFGTAPSKRQKWWSWFF